MTACAVVKPPTGGPEDKTPPSVISTSPTADSTGVGRESDVVISFSEKVDGESFKSRIETYPALDFEKIYTRGTDLVINFREELPETTICVLIKSGFKDDHLVVSRKNHIFFFSTSDSLESGEISGKILFKQRPDSSGVARLVRISEDTISDLYREKESRTAFADKFGDYRFRALPAGGNRYLVWSFIDKDSDGRYSAGKEFATAYPDTILLSSLDRSIGSVDMNIIDPDEPGTIKGVIRNMTAFPGQGAVRFNNLEKEDIFYYAQADTTGSYFVRKAVPGIYQWISFIDLKPDSIPGEYTDPEDSTKVLAEPFVISADTLKIDPGEARVLATVELTTWEKDER